MGTGQPGWGQLQRRRTDKLANWARGRCRPAGPRLA